MTCNVSECIVKGGGRWAGNLKSHLLNHHPAISKIVDEEDSKKIPASAAGNIFTSKNYAIRAFRNLVDLMIKELQKHWHFSLVARIA